MGDHEGAQPADSARKMSILRPVFVVILIDVQYNCFLRVPVRMTASPVRSVCEGHLFHSVHLLCCARQTTPIVLISTVQYPVDTKWELFMIERCQKHTGAVDLLPPRGKPICARLEHLLGATVDLRFQNSQALFRIEPVLFFSGLMFSHSWRPDSFERTHGSHMGTMYQ
ncbi:hypothetical protein BGZ63DRAFT_392407 [Mariannaea sp. PMI_226]|nr:hypothetical protein BGZ63DRAFT_392407 [Mariannaea sp. PMI_226]